MAGLVPAIHVFRSKWRKVGDARLGLEIKPERSSASDAIQLHPFGRPTRQA